MANNIKPQSKIKNSVSTSAFYAIAYIVVGFMALICLIPFIIVVSGSFTRETYLLFQVHRCLLSAIH